MLAPTQRHLLTIAILTFSLIRPSTAACYDWNGLEQGDEWQPCYGGSGTNTYSTCCATNRQTAFGVDPGKLIQNSDKCLSNGLCSNRQFTPTSSPGSGSSTNVTERYYRNGCTSNKPDDKYCLSKVCASAGKSAEVTPCDGPNSKTWCCGKTKDCCGKDSQWELPDTLGAAVPALGKIVATSSSSSASSTTPTPSSSPSSPDSKQQNLTTGVAGSSSTSSPTNSADPASNQTQDHQQQQQPTLAPGAIAGITIASVIAVAALIAVLFLKRRWDRKRENLERKVVKARQEQEMSQNAAYTFWGERIDTRSPPLELDDGERVHELHPDAAPHEIGLDVAAAQVQETKDMV